MRDMTAEEKVRTWRMCSTRKTETTDVALERKKTLNGGCEKPLQLRKVRERILQSLLNRNTPREHLQPRETEMHCESTKP